MFNCCEFYNAKYNNLGEYTSHNQYLYRWYIISSSNSSVKSACPMINFKKITVLKYIKTYLNSEEKYIKHNKYVTNRKYKKKKT